MKKATSEVRSKSRVVATCEYEVFDSVAEAVEAKGEQSILNLINAQVRTNAMNLARAKATGKPSRKALEAEALSLITIEEFQACAGDQVELRNLINRKVAELEAKYAAGAPSIEEDDEDDES